jgi:hypothetical protein
MMRRLAVAALIAASMAHPFASGARADDPRSPTATDANLVTALDASDSIMRHEEWLQFEGMADAIESEAFFEAATAGDHGRIGFAVIVWSSTVRPDVVVPWTLIETPQDARRAADALRAARSRYGFAVRMGLNDGATTRGGDDLASSVAGRRTDLSAALDVSTDLLGRAPFATGREVINICGNGVDNVGAGPAAARDRALSSGAVINGLSIGHRGGVADYYRAYIQGGEGSFVLEVRQPGEMAAAMLEKFLRDLKVARVGTPFGAAEPKR